MKAELMIFRMVVLLVRFDRVIRQDDEWRAPEPDTRYGFSMLSIRRSKDIRSAGLRASPMACW
jgi:hypothetical protein